MEEEPFSQRKDRSPSYPSISLEAAVGRARVVYENERRHAAPLDSLYRAWGFKGRTGPAQVTLAALKKYGLLEDEGIGAARKAQLTDLAMDIVLAPSNDHPDRVRALREAALKPTIFAALREEFGDQLPSDDTVRYYLVRERKFMESAAKDVIRNYRATMEFAGVRESDTVSDESEFEEESVTVSPPTVHRAPPGSVPQFAPGIRLPLGGGQWASLDAAFPLTKEAWNQMAKILNVMKPNLIDGGGEGATDLELEQP